MQVKNIENYQNHGKALQLTDGMLEVVVPLMIGPRIMHFSLACKPSIFETDAALEEKLPDGDIMRLYGGHRTWHSPEAFPRSYMPDNEPLESYEIYDNGIKLVQKQEPWTQMQKCIELFFEDGHVRVSNSITNNNAWPIEYAVWALTIGSRGGREICPVVQRNTGLQTNTGYRSWPYSRMDDHRVRWGQRYIVVENDPKDESAFKFGYGNEAGWIAYFNHGQCFIKAFDYIRGAKYPDEGSSYQTYSSSWGIELESLSPLKLVKPGKTYTHEECWYIVESKELPPYDDEGIEKVMKPIAEATGIVLPAISDTQWDPTFSDDDD